MRRSRLVIAGVLLAVGLGWTAQGSGVIAGSAMSGNSFWAIVGVILLVGGVLIGVREVMRRPSAPQ